MIAQHFRVGVDTKICIRNVAARPDESGAGGKQSVHAFKPAGLLEDGLGNAWRLGVFSGCGIDVAPNGSTGDGVQILIGNRVKMAAGAIKKVAFGDGCSRKELLGSALANGDKTVLSGLDSHGCAPCGLRTV
jgi:hypothetical protein